MEWYEINAAMKYSHYSIKDGWEQARLITYMVAQVNSKHTLKMSDILQFPWEKDNDPVDNKPITKEDIERLKAEALRYIRQENITKEKRETTNG